MQCYQIMQRLPGDDHEYPAGMAYTTEKKAQEGIERIEGYQKQYLDYLRCSHSIRPIYVEGVVAYERLEKALGIQPQIPMEGVPSDAEKTE